MDTHGQQPCLDHYRAFKIITKIVVGHFFNEAAASLKKVTTLESKASLASA